MIHLDFGMARTHQHPSHNQKLSPYAPPLISISSNAVCVIHFKAKPSKAP